ncbi:MAG: hypothetical protein SV422_10980 [Pseudomonadota bacterium]|nr:hypothetical protein [Pseudomonadota bacterium]
MRSTPITTGFALLLCWLSLPALAQWPDWPTPNVPRLADGSPDYDAPAPRTADGRPDLSGLWELWGRSRPGRAEAQRLEAEGLQREAESGAPPLASFFDLGANIEGGLPYLDWARELRDQRVAAGMKDNPDANCLPIGHMQLHLHPQPRKIVQLPHLIVMMWEANGGLRQVFMDGRPLPDNDPQPWYYGYSIGHWEGDALIVETTGFRDDVWLDVNGSPLTSNGKITERFTRVSYGKMQVDVTIEDPSAYSEAFTVRVEHGLMLDTELIEFVCNENEQSTQYFDP